MKIVSAILIGLILVGCVKPSDTSTDWQKFAAKWKKATIQEKKQMTDVFKIHERFQSKDEKSVIAVFGEPSFNRKNQFNQYEIRYDFDPVPETDGKILQHLSFIIEKEAVVRVEANILPE